MKILICSEVYPDLSGIAQHTKEISRILIESGNSVEIICSKQKGKSNCEKLNRIKIFRIKFQEIASFMHGKNYDLVIVLWYVYLKSAVENFKNVIYIAPSIRSTSFKSLSEKLTSEEKEKILLEKQGMKKCRKIIYPSKIIKQQAKKEYGIKNGIVIPHGINLKRFSPSAEKFFEVITIANLHDYRKGVDKLIEVARKTDKTFIVLGEGKFRHAYEQKIRSYNLSNIKLIGKKENIQDFLKQSKVYVLPSIYEAFGLVLIEAMASGLPCIAFNPHGKEIQTASGEIIKNNKTGFLVKNEKEMTEKINLLLSDENLRRKMGREAFKESKKYSSEKEVDKILKFANVKNTTF